MNQRPLVVLVHGFWHGAWCWTAVTSHLAHLGTPSVAVDLLGHGLRAARPDAQQLRPFDAERFSRAPSPNATITLQAAADQLISDLEEASPERPVLLVAHSMGGTVANNAAQRRPDLVAGLVYLTAYMPASDTPAIAYARSDDNAGELVSPSLVADQQLTGALRLDPGSDDQAYLAGLREAFYGDVDEDRALAAIRLLTPDAPAAIAGGATELSADGWGAIPRTYVRCSKDNAIRPALQDRMVAEADAAFADNPTQVLRIDASHSPFLSQPEAIARIIAGTARS